MSTEPVQSVADVDVLSREADELDAEVIAALIRRGEIERRLVAARLEAGAPRAAHCRGVRIVSRYRAALGPDGATLGAAVLRLGRI